MKYKLVLLVLLGLISCKQEVSESETEGLSIENVDERINLLMDNWHKAAADANAEGYFGALKDESVFIGTQEDEIWDKEAFYGFSKPYFDKGKAWDFTARYRNIHQNDDGTSVYFDELLDTWMGECRGSGYIEYDEEDEQFYIMHYVLSLTVPNDKMNDVISAIGLVEPRE